MIARIRAALRLIGQAPELAGAIVTNAPAPRGMVPCLDHAGRKCLRCARIDGIATAYHPEPVSVVGWTDRAHEARILAARADNPARRRELLNRAAQAWAESIAMAPPVGRGNLLDQAVRDYLAAGRPEEAAFIVEEYSAYASELALTLTRDLSPDEEGFGIGARISIRRKAEKEMEKAWRRGVTPLLVVVSDE